MVTVGTLRAALANKPEQMQVVIPSTLDEFDFMRVIDFDVREIDFDDDGRIECFVLEAN